MAVRLKFATLWDNIVLPAATGPDLRGTPDADTVEGTDLAERLFGLQGDDVLIGLGGSDSIYGGEGNDLIHYIPGDIVDGGPGTDAITVDMRGATSGAGINLTGANPSLKGIEGVTGTLSRYDDIVIADGWGIGTPPFGLQLDGGLGNDLIELDYRKFTGIELQVTSVSGKLIVQIVASGGPVSDGGTLIGFEKVRIYGTPGRDYFVMGASNDTINGGNGNDWINGGNGLDQLYGENGDDTLQSAGGADTAGDALYGGTGNDWLSITSGTARNDSLYGGDGDDTLYFGNTQDVVFGGTGYDNATLNLVSATTAVVIGGPAGLMKDVEQFSGTLTNLDDQLTMNWRPLDNASPVIDGGKGVDRLTLTFGMIDAYANATIFFKPGEAIATRSNGMFTTTLLIKNFESFDITGTNRNDSIVGGDRGDILTGGSGNDTIMGDTTAPTAGHDLIDGGDGNDYLYAGTGNNTVFGGNGNDQLSGEGQTDLLYGGEGNDILASNGGVDRLFGDGGDDSIRSGVGNDMVYGGSGNDEIYGEGGNDTLSGGSGYDDFVFDYLSRLGNKVIADFEIGFDVVYISPELGEFEIDHIDGNTVVTWEGGSVTVLDVLLE